MDPTELCYRPATDLTALIRAREVSPTEVARAFLARIERVNPTINAYCTVTADRALAEAAAVEAALGRGDPVGPLAGVPVSIKDLLLTKGIRTTRGSLLYADDVPTEDAPVIERLRAAGAILLGKTNTPEFGWQATTDNRIFRPTRNPWNLERTSGGSSGGAGAAVAAGLGPLAIGTDGGGSIRILVGLLLRDLRPEADVWPGSRVPGRLRRGALPHRADDPNCPRRGAHAERDCWLRSARSEHVSNWHDRLPEEHWRRYRRTSGRLESGPWPRFGRSGGAGGRRERRATVHRAWLPRRGLDTTGRRHFWPMDHALLRRDRRRIIGPTGRLGRKDRSGPAPNRRLRAWRERDRSRPGLPGPGPNYDVVRRFFETYDLLLTPSFPVRPWRLDQDYPGEIAGQKPGPSDVAQLSSPFNLTGQPAATVPCGWTTDGLPLGLQIVGRRHEDALVLRAAAAFEAIAPWADRRPSVG